MTQSEAQQVVNSQPEASRNSSSSESSADLHEANGVANDEANGTAHGQQSGPTMPETKPRGTPPIDIKCGPLLRYLGMRDKAPDAWRGTAMIVTNDETSDYSTVPTMSLNIAKGTDEKSVQAEKIHQEQGVTFWRFALDFQMLQSEEQAVNYSINNDESANYTFYIPAIDQTMNTMFHSCNGFSFAVDTNEFKSSLWKDVLKYHEENHYHVMLGGGDQIYCDSIKADCPEFAKWAEEKNPVRKHQMKFDQTAQDGLSKYFLWHYIKWFGQGFWRGANGSTLQPALPLAMAQIPMVNIFDDHDIIDGFGSYADHTMRVPMFNGVGNTAFKYYLLFQHQCSLEESTQDEPSWDLGESNGPYIKQKSRSVYSRLGKSMAFYGLDCRTERKRHEVVTKSTYLKMFERITNEVRSSDGEIKHLLLMLGVPVAYPRLVWLENVLSSKMMTPIKKVAKHTMLSGMMNSFDGSIEILDDLDDHWCAKHHKRERNWLINQLFELGKTTGCRISILSGDVHLTGIGRFYSKSTVEPAQDPNLIFNVISSAIVNTPPPDKLADFLNKRNKIHHLSHQVDEDMVPIFGCDVDGTKRNNKRLLPRRNWCSIQMQGQTATNTARAAGPAWDVLNHSGTELSLPENEPKYPDDPSSLSVVIHVERDQHDDKSTSCPYELLVPTLNL